MNPVALFDGLIVFSIQSVQCVESFYDGWVERVFEVCGSESNHAFFTIIVSGLLKENLLPDLCIEAPCERSFFISRLAGIEPTNTTTMIMIHAIAIKEA